MSTAPHSSDTQASALSTGAWQLDPAHSSVSFQVPHFWGLMTVKGQFKRYHGVLNLQSEPAIELTIDADSVDTGNGKRDKHLRSADFFGVEENPNVRFVSDATTLEGDRLRVRGKLEAAGKSIPVELVATVRAVDGGLEVQAPTEVTHRDLGMTWSPLGMTRPSSKLLLKGLLVRAGA
jgi:polyisoprenoid-binding protein YceI